MAVLIEAISVVIRVDAVEKVFQDNLEQFYALVPNNTLCIDSELARIGFMTPDDVETFVNRLDDLGFEYIKNNKAIGLVVVDQQRGPMVACDWIEFGHVDWDEQGHQVAACRLCGTQVQEILTPDGWEYEGSLTETFAFVPSEHVDKSLKFLRSEGNVDVYLNLLTGKEAYVGRNR